MINKLLPHHPLLAFAEQLPTSTSTSKTTILLNAYYSLSFFFIDVLNINSLIQNYELKLNEYILK